MAFSFGNTGGGSGFNSNSNGGAVKELQEIETEALGYHAFAGDAKVQLLPAWPSDALPPPTSSLLSVASKRGILAAGGATSVIIAATDSVREAFNGAGGNVKQFTPQLTLDLGARISQVAFSSDESVLAISAEQGGGLAVYEVDNLLKGSTASTFEVGTGQTSLRALVPNPGVDASLFAVVTMNGQLLMADMKSRQLSNPLRDGVSCVAWSVKGKQLVAGLGDGTAVQMTPTGEIKAQLPRPPGLASSQHLSSVAWLSNNEFLVVHTPTASDQAHSSEYHIVNRVGDSFEFQKLPEVCGPWGLSRAPAAHFMQRLSHYPPDLVDTIIVSSTVAEDIGMFTKSKKSLSTIPNTPGTTDVYTATTMANDGRRAALPMQDGMDITSPIGMALDLSSKTPVHRPLPGEEMDESQTPLPALLVLNNAGVLAGWWIAYADSIRAGTAYPGLVNATQQSVASSSFGASTGTKPSFGASAPAQPAFGQSSFGSSSTSTFGGAIKPATGTFGAPSSFGSSTPAFGQASSIAPPKPAFGSTSNIGSNGPVFGSSSTLGKPGTAPTANTATFGSTSSLGNRASPFGGGATTSGAAAFGKPAFGNASAIGGVKSPWAAAGSGSAVNTTSTPVFGQPSAPTNQPSPFGASSQSTFGSGASQSTGAGFASFAASGGFAAAAKGPSLFGNSTPAAASFGKKSESSIFGTKPDSTPSLGTKAENSSIFGSKPATTTNGGVFGTTGSNFNLGSAWKNDNASKETPKAAEVGGSSLFGTDFGKTLGDASKASDTATSKEQDMSDGISDTLSLPNSPTSPPPLPQTTTPAETPAPPKFYTAPPTTGGLFGTQAQQKPTPAAVETSKPALSFSTPVTKVETPSELPLPPDATSKATFTPTNSSAASTDSALKITPEPSSTPSWGSKPSMKETPSVSSEATVTTTPVGAERSTATNNNEDAPLPPDFLPQKAKSALPKTPTESKKFFFSSEPDQNEFGSSDEEAEDEVSNEEEEKEDGSDREEEADEEEEQKEEEEDRDEDNDEASDGDDEGSGIDVAEDLTKPSTESSLGRQSSGLTDGSWANVTAPSQQQSFKSNTTLFGGPSFSPKARQPDNERSPSPERRMPPGLLRSEAARSVSAPNIASRQKVGLPRSMKQVAKPVVSFDEKHRQTQARVAQEAMQRRVEEEQPLEDDAQDAAVRQLLADPIEGSLELDEFITHQDYANDVTKAGVAGEIERLYRDINSMIDTIGLNCRNMQGFTKGHEEGVAHERRLEDLDGGKPWTLAEIEDLSNLENELQGDLDDARLHNVRETIHSVAQLESEFQKLKAQQKEIRAFAETKFGSLGGEDNYQDLELSHNQHIQRQTLRNNFKTFQASLTEAESAIALLRTKLATTLSTRNGSPNKVPTVEAVETTIRKLTSMVERKSGDIDVLENQMRKMNIHPSTPNGSRNGSREPSPFIGSPSPIRKNRLSLLGGGRPNTGSPLRNGWRASTNSMALGQSTMSTGSTSASERGRGAQPKKLSDYVEDDIAPFVKRAQRKKEIMGALREALLGRDGKRVVEVIPVD